MTAAETPYAAAVSALDRPLLRAVPESVVDAELDVDALGSRIVGLAGRLAAATCRWLLLVAAFDARDGCARFGLSTTARWLSHYCGLSRRTAIEHVRVARALAAHGQLAAAMGTGRLSYSHVRAISRIADRGTSALVADLINVAEHGTVGQLEDIVRGLRCVDDNQGDDAEPDPENLSWRWRPDSRYGLSAKLDPENGTLVQSAIEAVARAEGLTQAQALTRIAEIALAAIAADGKLPTLRGDEHAAVVVHLDAAAVPAEPASASAETRSRERADATNRERSRERRRPFARIADGPGLADRVIRRLLCSGRVRTVVHDRDGTPLDLGRSHRVVSEKLFRALVLRDGGCAHPGRGSGHGLEAHHVRHWLHGGRTDLGKLASHQNIRMDGRDTLLPEIILKGG
jgi:hypothetical protein